MYIEINEKQLKMISKISQTVIDGTLDRIRKDPDDYFIDYGVDDISKIVISHITTHTRLAIYVDIYVEGFRYDYDELTSEISHNLRKFFPNSVVLTNEVIDEREFGPGIDW